MTSAKSSDKAFRFSFFRTMRKNWYFPALISAAVSFATIILGLFSEWIVYTDKGSYSYYDGLSFKEWIAERVGRVYLLGEVVMETPVFVAFIMILAMATGIMIFRYMFSKKAVNVYYSLGITRQNMFLSKYISGAVLIVTAVLIPIVIVVILNLAIFGSTKELLITALFYFLGTVLSLLYAYSVSVAVCCRVGTVVEAIVYSGVFLIAPILITTVINFLSRFLLYGSPVHECEWIYGWTASKFYGTGLWVNSDADFNNNISAYNTVPFAKVFDFQSEIRTSDEWYMPDFKSLIPLAFLVAVVFLAALATYKNRKTETAGFLGCDEFIKAISVFLLSSAAACIAVEILNELTFINVSIGICFAAVVFFCVYIAFEIVSLHNVRKIFKSLWKYLIHLSVASLVILIFTNGLFGYSSRVPNAEDVESVSVSTGTGDVMMNYDELSFNKHNSTGYDLADSFLLAGVAYQGVVDGITDKNDIEYITEIHREFIDCKNLKVNDETLNAGFGKRVFPVNIHFVYNLKNGKTVKRMYPVATDEIMQMLAEITETERYKELAIDYIQKPVPVAEYNEYFDEYYYSSEPVYGLTSVKVETVAYESVSEMPFTFRGVDVAFASPLLSEITFIPDLSGDNDLKSGLLNAICEDIRNGSLPLNYRSNSKVLGYIVFDGLIREGEEYDSSSIRYQGGTVVTDDMTEPAKINNFGGEFKMCTAGRVSVPIYEDMTNTVGFIKSNGYDVYLNESSAISKIRVWVPDEQSVADVNTYNGASMLWCGWWFNTDETCLLVPGNASNIKDKKEIEKISSYCTMMSLVCYETNYAEIIFEDGSRSYASIPIK